jgi:hypothetical protein
MFGSGHDLEVLGAVVRLHAIDVMHHLPGLEASSEFGFAHDTVFSPVAVCCRAALDGDLPVAVLRQVVPLAPVGMALSAALLKAAA